MVFLEVFKVWRESVSQKEGVGEIPISKEQGTCSSEVLKKKKIKGYQDLVFQFPKQNIISVVFLSTQYP